MPPRTASRFASRGAFDALATEDSEPEIEEGVEEDRVASIESQAQHAAQSDPNSTPSKMTRAAQRKAAAKERKGEGKKSKGEKKNLSSSSSSSSSSNGKNKSVKSSKEEEDGGDEKEEEKGEKEGEEEEERKVGSSMLKSRSNPSATSRGNGGPANARLQTGTGAERPDEPVTTAAPPPALPAAVTDKAAQERMIAKPTFASAAMPSSQGAHPSKSETMNKKESQKEKDEARMTYWKKVYERTTYTFLMIGGFIGLLLLGHPYMIILVLVIQVLVYREVTALFNIPGRPSVTGGAPNRGPLETADSSRAGSAVQSEDEDDEMGGREGRRKEEFWSKTLSWYFFAVTNYFLYGESLIYYFKHIVFVDAYFIPFARHHRFLSFMLYIFGFMAFVSGLKRSNLKHQFGLFCWVHMSLFLTVYSSHFIVNNILEGLIWFFVPASLVICNDVFAYVCGMMFGRTPLISLSPKKTVEGFIGALIVTEIFAYLWGSLFQRYRYMICPAVSLGMNAFSQVQCDPNPVFLWHYLPLPSALSTLLTNILSPITQSLFDQTVSITSLPYTPFQLHALVMAAFASLVAPFGGFFASGFKRAFNIKDFGDSIPGHGGLTDRFDCQFLMGLFSYVYYSSLIREHHVSVGSVLQTVVTHLTVEDQVELYRELTRFLDGQGIKV